MAFDKLALDMSERAHNKRLEEVLKSGKHSDLSIRMHHRYWVTGVLLEKETQRLEEEINSLAAKLADAQNWSDSLQAVGVDNWEGYDEACEMYGNG